MRDELKTRSCSLTTAHISLSFASLLLSYSFTGCLRLLCSSIQLQPICSNYHGRLHQGHARESTGYRSSNWSEDDYLLRHEQWLVHRSDSTSVSFTDEVLLCLYCSSLHCPARASIDDRHRLHIGYTSLHLLTQAQLKQQLVSLA